MPFFLELVSNHRSWPSLITVVVLAFAGTAVCALQVKLDPSLQPFRAPCYTPCCSVRHRKSKPTTDRRNFSRLVDPLHEEQEDADVERGAVQVGGSQQYNTKASGLSHATTVLLWLPPCQ